MVQTTRNFELLKQKLYLKKKKKRKNKQTNNNNT